MCTLLGIEEVWNRELFIEGALYVYVYISVLFLYPAKLISNKP